MDRRLVDLTVGDMHFRARPTDPSPPGKEWMGWCARTTALGNSPMDVSFHIDCWFEFASTAEAVFAKLKAEVFH